MIRSTKFFLDVTFLFTTSEISIQMNRSVTSLTLTNLYGQSPFIFHNAMSSKSELTVRKLRIQNSFTNFFRSSNMQNKVSFHNSNFKNFLNNAISINSVVIKDEVRNRQSIFEHDILDFINCQFIDIVGSEDGGAINFKKEEGRLTLTNCLFARIESPANGGAINFQGLSYLFKKSCFDHCKSSNQGQAYYIKLSRENADGTEGLEGTVSNTWIDVCAPVIFGRIQHATLVESGKANSMNCNYSRGLVDKGASCIFTLRANVELIQYTHFCNNKGEYVLDMEFSTYPALVEKCNFINNTIPHNKYTIQFCSTTEVRNCFFYRNSKPLTRSPIGPQKTITFTDCIHDGFGFPENHPEILVNNCDTLEGIETTIPGEIDNTCMNQSGSRMFKNFSFSFIVVAMLAIITTHIVFIHPELFGNLYTSLFFDSGNSRRRRRVHVESV